MLIDYKKKAFVAPLPCLLIGSYDENNVANLMTLAWGAPIDYDKIVLTISFNHKSTQNILKNKSLTIAFANKELVDIVDYVGLVSNNNINKLDSLNLNIEKSKNVNAPIFVDFPFSLECEFVSYDEENEMMIVKVINTLIDDKYIINDEINVKDMHLIAYNSLNRNYTLLGEDVAKAYFVGKKYMK